ncbi:MAG: hypothetical protein ACYSWP_24685 [Planctomycetota bacterium]
MTKLDLYPVQATQVDKKTAHSVSITHHHEQHHNLLQAGHYNEWARCLSRKKFRRIPLALLMCWGALEAASGDLPFAGRYMKVSCSIS